MFHKKKKPEALALWNSYSFGVRPPTRVRGSKTDNKRRASVTEIVIALCPQSPLNKQLLVGALLAAPLFSELSPGHNTRPAPRQHSPSDCIPRSSRPAQGF